MLGYWLASEHTCRDQLDIKHRAHDVQHVPKLLWCVMQAGLGVLHAMLGYILPRQVMDVIVAKIPQEAQSHSKLSAASEDHILLCHIRSSVSESLSRGR
jgi:hypothetical protein